MSNGYKIFFIFFLSLIPSVSLAAINDGLVGQWSMDGKRTNWTTNTVSNSVSGGNSATMTGIPTSTAPIIGAVGQGLNLTNGNDFLTVSNYSAINQTSQITISLWVKRYSNATGREFIINKGTCGNTATCQFYMEFPSDNTVTFYLTEGVNDRTLNSVATIGSLNTWHHVVGTYDGTTQKIYFDGALINQNNWSGTLQTLSSDMVIGYLSSGTFYMNGAIDDVKIYDRALSEREVSQLYKADKSKASASQINTLKNGLISYYTMDGKDMNYVNLTATDRGSNKLTGTLVSLNTNSAVVGKIGSALRTGATAAAQYISISETADDSITNQWSTSVWVYRKGSSDGTIVRNDEGNGNRGFLIDVFSNNARSYAYVNGVNVATGVTTLSTGKWYHLVGVCDGATVKIYLNGVQDGSTSIGSAGNIGLSSSPLYIGYGNFANSNFDGYIDDVRIYNRALSLNEIEILYKEGQNKQAVSPTKSLTSGLVGYWTFDGKDTNWMTNTTSDKSTSGNTGRLSSMSTSTDQSIGKIGQALKFDGADNEVTTSNDQGSGSNIKTFSISTWFKTTSTSGAKIVGLESNSTGTGSSAYDRMIYIGTDGKAYFYIYDGAPQLVNSSLLYNDNKWHHAVGVSTGDSGTITLYIDGINVASKSIGSMYTGYATSFWRIGGYKVTGAGITNGADGYFSGSIDEVRIYNKALTEADVKELYNLGQGKIR